VRTSEDPWRRSRLAGVVAAGQAGRDAAVLHAVTADLHNHSLNSDGLGDPERAFGQMRAAGLDVAALTDHASTPKDLVASLSLEHYPTRDALALGRLPPRSIDAGAWARVGEIADAHDVPGEFTAVRGFEWTEPWLGHVNVWFSTTYVPVLTPGTTDGVHGWLAREQPGALFGYNHPGREPGRLHNFPLPSADLDPGGTLLPRMVAAEVFNRTEDFLFGGYAERLPSPVVDLLDAGWRPGLTGSSDEHGRCYGLVGKGRTGLWVRELSREGVREALTSRRTFATREVGLRLDAALDGVRMGGVLDATGPAGRRTLVVDVALPGDDGRPVELQLLTSAHPAGTAPAPATQVRPTDPADAGVRVLARLPATLGTLAVTEVEVPDGVPWVLLRVADPSRRHGAAAPREHPANCWALGYASPWSSSGSRPPGSARSTGSSMPGTLPGHDRV
jgi:hypothetical protein